MAEVEDGLLEELPINEIKEDYHKLTFLRSHAGPDLFPLHEKVRTFMDPVDILDKQFKTPTRIIYARHQLLSCLHPKT